MDSILISIFIHFDSLILLSLSCGGRYFWLPRAQLTTSFVGRMIVKAMHLEMFLTKVGVDAR